MSKSHQPPATGDTGGGDQGESRHADRLKGIAEQGNAYQQQILARNRSGVRDKSEEAIDDGRMKALNALQSRENLVGEVVAAEADIDAMSQGAFAKDMVLIEQMAGDYDADIKAMQDLWHGLDAEEDPDGRAKKVIYDDLQLAWGSMSGATALAHEVFQPRSALGEAVEGSMLPRADSEKGKLQEEVTQQGKQITDLLGSAQQVHLLVMGAGDVSGDDAAFLVVELAEHFEAFDATSMAHAYLFKVFEHSSPNPGVFRRMQWTLGLDTASRESEDMGADGAGGDFEYEANRMVHGAGMFGFDPEAATTDAPAHLQEAWATDEVNAAETEQALADEAIADGMGGYTDGVMSYATADEAHTAIAERQAREAAEEAERVRLQEEADAVTDYGDGMQDMPGGGVAGAAGPMGMLAALWGMWNPETGSPAAAAPTGELLPEGEDKQHTLAQAAANPHELGPSDGHAAALAGNVKPVDPTKAVNVPMLAASHKDQTFTGPVPVDDAAPLDHKTDKVSGSALIEQDKVTTSLGLARTNQAPAQHDSTSAALSGVIGKDTVGGGLKAKRVKGNSDKNNAGHAADAGFVAGPDGKVVSAGVKKIKTVDGKDSSKGLNAAANLDKKQLTIGGHSTTGSDLKEKGTTGSMTMGLDKNWDLNFVELAGKYKTGKGGNVGAKLTIGTDVGDVTEGKDGFTVDYSDTVGLGASAGYDKGIGSGSGNKAGGSVGYRSLEKSGGKRTFKTKQEAEDFRKQLKSGKMAMTDPQSADAVLALGSGDTTFSSQLHGVDVEAHGSYGVVSAGVSGSTSSIDDTKITRGEGATVVVARAHTSMDSGAISGGMGGVSVSAGKGAGSLSGNKVAFDLSTAAGKEAYEAFVKDGTLLPIPGVYRQVETEKATMESSSVGLSMPGVSLSNVNEYIEGKREGDDGKVEYSIGTEKTGISVLGWGHSNESHGMEIMEVDDKERFYTARSGLDNSNRDSDAHDLGKSTGGWDGHTSSGYFNGKDSRGQWNVTSVFTEEEVMGGIGQKAKDGGKGDKQAYENWSNLPAMYKDTMDGPDAMAAALGGEEPDMDLFRQGMARWVSEEGIDAIEETRKLAGFDDYTSTGGHGEDGGQRYFVDLVGDKWWTGFQGYKMAERQVIDLESRAGDSESDKLRVLTELQTLHKYLGDKIVAVATYEEVPVHLMRQEQDRCRELMDRLDIAAGQARTNPGAYEDEVEGVSKSETIADDDPRWARVTKMETRVRLARESAHGVYAEAAHQHFVHHETQMPYGGGTPRKYVQGGGSEEAYVTADAAWERGLRRTRQARAAEDMVRELGTDQDQPGTVLMMLLKARSEYQRSIVDFRGAIGSYRRVQGISEGQAPNLQRWWYDMQRRTDTPLEF